MLTRRTVIQGALTALRKKKPNFLFLIADDHAGYVLGADGNKIAMTPNIDRLASEGTRFARNFCNSPVCTPSRQCFFTGQMPHAAGVTVLSTPLSEEKQTLAKQLRKGGYSTAVFGKMHFNRPSHPDLHGFDYLMTENDVTKFWSEEKPALPVPSEVDTKKLPWRPFKDPAETWLNAGRLPYPRMLPEMRSSFLAR
jgi:choline-sulfatase